MTNPQTERIDWEVSLDHASLRGHESGNSVRYTVGMRGPADPTWADAWSAVQESSLPHRRFQLDRKARQVGFSCPIVEGPAFVFEMLERLEELLALIERRLADETPVPPAPSTTLRPLA